MTARSADANLRSWASTPGADNMEIRRATGHFSSVITDAPTSGVLANSYTTMRSAQADGFAPRPSPHPFSSTIIASQDRSGMPPNLPLRHHMSVLIDGGSDLLLPWARHPIAAGSVLA
jgi:hypothetical protein